MEWENEIRDVVLWREQGIGDDIIFLGLSQRLKIDRGTFKCLHRSKACFSLCERSMPGIDFFLMKQLLRKSLIIICLWEVCHACFEKQKMILRRQKGYLKADPGKGRNTYRTGLEVEKKLLAYLGRV